MVRDADGRAGVVPSFSPQSRRGDRVSLSSLLHPPLTHTLPHQPVPVLSVPSSPSILSVPWEGLAQKVGVGGEGRAGGRWYSGRQAGVVEGKVCWEGRVWQAGKGKKKKVVCARACCPVPHHCPLPPPPTTITILPSSILEPLGRW